MSHLRQSPLGSSSVPLLKKTFPNLAYLLTPWNWFCSKAFTPHSEQKCDARSLRCFVLVLRTFADLLDVAEMLFVLRVLFAGMVEEGYRMANLLSPPHASAVGYFNPDGYRY